LLVEILKSSIEEKFLELYKVQEMPVSGNMRCEACNRSITEDQYFVFDGLCNECHNVIVEERMYNEIESDYGSDGDDELRGTGSD
jgi:Zn finger protein HypA/HybF involved in hydrogenase expression